MFEKYQNFIAIIIAGALIAGGIMLSRGNQNQQPRNQETEKTVTRTMLSIARSVGIDTQEFQACLDDESSVQKIINDVEIASSAGVQGTPTFIVIKRTYDAQGNITRQQEIPVVGARNLETFETVILTGNAPFDQGPFEGAKTVLTENDYWKGPRDAKVIIVKYSDIDCPFCKRAWTTIDALLVKNPDYALVYRHSPILSLHPLAGYKAQGSECARRIGGEEAFWKFIDRIAR